MCVSVGICKWKPALLADSSRDSPWQPGTVISSAAGEVQLQSLKIYLPHFITTPVCSDIT